MAGEEDCEAAQSYLDRPAANVPTNVVPGRLNHLFSTGVKKKRSDYFAMFGPNSARGYVRAATGYAGLVQGRIRETRAGSSGG
jgi:hypothetical protein